MTKEELKALAESWHELVKVVTGAIDNARNEGWRAGVEECAVQDDQSSDECQDTLRRGAYKYSAEEHRELTPPAAQPAEEGKHGHR